jgi:hypothetical protein
MAGHYLGGVVASVAALAELIAALDDGRPRGLADRPHDGMHQAARRPTSQTVAAMSSTDSAISQPPSSHWNGQNRVTGW